ncbi:MAG: hypothetical protein Q8M03_00930, partial [Legionella sp.]|nr:hypothetical protein [Legionella sp.]
KEINSPYQRDNISRTLRETKLARSLSRSKFRDDREGDSRVRHWIASLCLQRRQFLQDLKIVLCRGIACHVQFY